MRALMSCRNSTSARNTEPVVGLALPKALRLALRLQGFIALLLQTTGPKAFEFPRFFRSRNWPDSLFFFVQRFSPITGALS
jgi:hypothetical protein